MELGKNKQKGFTILELFIIIAIIGILAAIAIPSYCDYLGRAKVAEVFIAVKNTQEYIINSVINKNTVPTQQDAILKSLLPKNSNIESVSWFPKQLTLLIALTSNVTKDTKNSGKYFVLTLVIKDETSIWKCSNQHILIPTKPLHTEDLPISCR